MRQITGLLLLVGAALLFLSLTLGPGALYAGLVLGGLGLVALGAKLLRMLLS